MTALPISVVAALCMATAANALPLCGSGPRINCVVDGDTLWVEGVKYRLQDIDAPELRARCPSEARLAEQARDRLAELTVAFRIEDSGEVDRYGRALARIIAGNVSAGETLIREGLARPWSGHKEDWCK